MAERVSALVSRGCAAVDPEFERFAAALRRERRARGLSLAGVAGLVFGATAGLAPAADLLGTAGSFVGGWVSLMATPVAVLLLPLVASLQRAQRGRALVRVAAGLRAEPPLPAWLETSQRSCLQAARDLASALERERGASAEAERLLWGWLARASSLLRTTGSPWIEQRVERLGLLLREPDAREHDWAREVRTELQALEAEICRPRAAYRSAS